MLRKNGKIFLIFFFILFIIFLGVIVYNLTIDQYTGWSSWLFGTSVAPIREGYSLVGPFPTNLTTFDSAQNTLNSANTNAAYAAYLAANPNPQGTTLTNVDFSTPAGFADFQNDNYSVFCSNWGMYSNYPANASQYPGLQPYMPQGMQYNSGTRAAINDCLYDQRIAVLNKCLDASAALAQYAPYMSPATVSSYQSQINTNIPPGVLYNNGGMQYWSWPSNYGGQEVDIAQPLIYGGSGWQWYTGYWDQSHFTIGSMLPQMQTSWTACDNIQTQIMTDTINNCSLPQSIITTDSICGIDTALAAMQAQCEIAKTYATNASDTNSANLFQSYIDYNPVNPANQTLGEIQQNIANYQTECTTAYNDCTYTYNGSLMTQLDTSGIFQCIDNNPAWAASYTWESTNSVCEQALSDANMAGDSSGASQINEYLQNITTPSLIGTGGTINYLAAVSNTLSTVTQQCNSKIQMYNQWDALELAAQSSPCMPEEPIASTSDQTLNGLVQQWNVSTLGYLNELQANLEAVQEYLANTPNVLSIDKNIGFSVAGSNPIFTITGIPPNQVLNASVPGGIDGPVGPVGPVGGSGKPGQNGQMGSSGSVGKWEIPIQYYYGDSASQPNTAKT